MTTEVTVNAPDAATPYIWWRGLQLGAMSWRNTRNYYALKGQQSVCITNYSENAIRHCM